MKSAADIFRRVINQWMLAPAWQARYPVMTAWAQKIPEMKVVFEACRRAGIKTGTPNYVKVLRQETKGEESSLLEAARIQLADEYLLSVIGSHRPRIVITLGSGLGGFGKLIENQTCVYYKDIPGFPRPTIVPGGHAGRFIFGTINGIEVVAMDGRFHLYQNLSPDQVVRPLRALMRLHELGTVRYFIVTNAAGVQFPAVQPGNIILIRDHIDNTGRPLLPLDDFEPLFFDMSNTYRQDLRAIVVRLAEALNISLIKGVYQGNLGPAYETPAEVQAGIGSGSDSFGMSTVKEVQAVARHNMGIAVVNREKREPGQPIIPEIGVIGLTYKTNHAAGIVPGAKLSHDEVTEIAEDETASQRFAALMLAIVKDLSTHMV